MTEYSNPYSQSEYPATYSDPVLTASETEGAADRPLPGDGSHSGGDSDPSMKDKAAQSADAGKQAASAVAQTAADKAKDVAQETKTQARNVLGQAQDQLKQQTASQHQNLVSNLHALGDQLGSMAQGSEHSGYATDLVSQAGDRAHSAASFLESREPSELVDEVRRFARQKPGMFILGALAAGVVAGRLTRGVVAVHKDDSGSSDTATGDHATTDYASTDYAASDYTGGGYPAGTETTGYATTGDNGAAGYGSGGLGAGYGSGSYGGTTGYTGTPAGGIEP